MKSAWIPMLYSNIFNCAASVCLFSPEARWHLSNLLIHLVYSSNLNKNVSRRFTPRFVAMLILGRVLSVKLNKFLQLEVNILLVG